MHLFLRPLLDLFLCYFALCHLLVYLQFLILKHFVKPCFLYCFLSVSHLLFSHPHPDLSLFVLSLTRCQGDLWFVMIHSVMIQSCPLHDQKLECLVDCLHWAWTIPCLPENFLGQLLHLVLDDSLLSPLLGYLNSVSLFLCLSHLLF